MVYVFVAITFVLALIPIVAAFTAPVMEDDDSKLNDWRSENAYYEALCKIHIGQEPSPELIERALPAFSNKVKSIIEAVRHQQTDPDWVLWKRLQLEELAVWIKKHFRSLPVREAHQAMMDLYSLDWYLQQDEWVEAFKALDPKTINLYRFRVEKGHPCPKVLNWLLN